jgi:pyruvate dehydrogenase complex dehydrogenase (E1) component
VDAESIVVGTLWELAKAGAVARSEVTRAIRAFDIDPDKLDPALL